MTIGVGVEWGGELLIELTALLVDLGSSQERDFYWAVSVLLCPYYMSRYLHDHPAQRRDKVSAGSLYNFAGFLMEKVLELYVSWTESNMVLRLDLVL